MTKRLCIDIGGTRIKWSILPLPIDLENLRSLNVCSIRTQGWLNQTLDSLLDPSHYAGILNKVGDLSNIRDIAVAICAPISSEGRVLDPQRRGIPPDLRERFAQTSGRSVALINDAEAWLKGAVTYWKLSGRPFNYPAMVLTFGTGVGFAWAEDQHRIASIEFDHTFVFTELANAVEWRKFEPWQVHAVLGNEFFVWIGKDKPDWSYPRKRSCNSRPSGLILAFVNSQHRIPFAAPTRETGTCFASGEVVTP